MQETQVRSIPGLGRSPEEGNGNPLLYSCLENLMDRGAWQIIYSPWGHRVGHSSEHTHTHTHARSLKINSPFFLKADQIVSCCLQPRVLAHLHFHQVPSAVLLFQPGWLLLLFTPGLAQQGLDSFTGNAPLFSHGPACSWLRCLLPHENEPSPYWWLRPGVSPWSLWAPFHS